MHTITNAGTRTSRVTRVVIAALVLMLLLTACGASDSAETSGGEETAEYFDGAMTAESSDSAAFADDADAREGGPVGLVADAPAGGAINEPLPTTVSGPGLGLRIIKEGTVTVEVQPGDFDAAFGQIISRTQALGGYVSGSSSSNDDEGLVSGQVTVRVPVDAFEDLLTAIGDAGEVTDRNITSQDVSEEFTDLESRRRNLRAQETFYLGLLSEAQSVNDAIAVQQQLEGIQGQIEQLTGRLNLLEDRSSLSTLTVRLRETGADASASEGSGLAGSLREARDTMISVVGAIIVTAAAVLPFLLLVGLAFLGALVIRRLRRTAAPRIEAPQPATTNADLDADSADEHEVDASV